MRVARPVAAGRRRVAHATTMIAKHAMMAEVVDAILRVGVALSLVEANVSDSTQIIADLTLEIEILGEPISMDVLP